MSSFEGTMAIEATRSREDVLLNLTGPEPRILKKISQAEKRKHSAKLKKTRENSNALSLIADSISAVSFRSLVGKSFDDVTS